MPLASPNDVCHRPSFAPDIIYKYVDSDWASDTCHRRSVSGIAFLLAGGAVS